MEVVGLLQNTLTKEQGRWKDGKHLVSRCFVPVRSEAKAESGRSVEECGDKASESPLLWWDGKSETIRAVMVSRGRKLASRDLR